MHGWPSQVPSLILKKAVKIILLWGFLNFSSRCISKLLRDKSALSTTGEGNLKKKKKKDKGGGDDVRARNTLSREIWWQWWKFLHGTMSWAVWVSLLFTGYLWLQPGIWPHPHSWLQPLLWKVDTECQLKVTSGILGHEGGAGSAGKVSNRIGASSEFTVMLRILPSRHRKKWHHRCHSEPASPLML